MVTHHHNHHQQQQQQHGSAFGQVVGQSVPRFGIEKPKIVVQTGANETVTGWRGRKRNRRSSGGGGTNTHTVGHQSNKEEKGEKNTHTNRDTRSGEEEVRSFWSRERHSRPIPGRSSTCPRTRKEGSRKVSGGGPRPPSIARIHRTPILPISPAFLQRQHRCPIH